MNQWEVENGIEYTFAHIKQQIDDWMAQLIGSQSSQWTVRQNSSLCKVWTRQKGTDQLPSLPIARAEHFFPDIEDPRLIDIALNKFRLDWDAANFKAFERLPQYN